MLVTTSGADAASSGTRSQRWLARLSFAVAAAAVAIVVIFAGLRSFAMLAAGLAAAGVTLASAFFFLSRRGLLRWLSLVVFVLAPASLVVGYAFAGLLWVAIASAAGWLLAAGTARLALAGDLTDWRMPETPARPAAHPFLIMNPRSGGGKVGKFDLQRKAEELGAEVFLMGGPQQADVAKIASDAVAAGADLLGVAGGDGTQALVAGVAAQHDIPFMVITAGTRNHFALDLGLDRDNPAACLSALSDGVELRVDLGLIGERTFVNNASFGAYADVVETAAYRNDKVGTTLNMLPDLLTGHGGAHFGAGRRHRDQRAAGRSGRQQSLRSRRHRRSQSPDTPGSRCPRRCRRPGRQRASGNPTAPGDPEQWPPRTDSDAGRCPRRHRAGTGRRRRRSGDVAHAGDLHYLPRRLAGPGAPEPARQRPAAARCELGTAERPRAARAARSRRRASAPSLDGPI